MGMFDWWNKNKFSIYDSEEKTVLTLIQKMLDFFTAYSKELDAKTDVNGDHKGSWQGINRPTLSEEGMRGTVEKHMKDIESIFSLQGANPLLYGAKGDGLTDDTTVFETMINLGLNITLPEKTFLISRPLYINVNKQWIRGTSTRSKLKASDTFPTNDFMITFYSSNGDYYSRHLRENIHGNFELLGNKNINGFRTGGVIGTEKEGHCECQTFMNIRVDNFNIGYGYGSHSYRNTFINLDTDRCEYSIKSDDDQFDSGEVTTFINCGLWTGSLYLKASCNFYSSTIHFTKQNTKDSLYFSHYFDRCHISFTDCHFETILRTQEDYDKVNKNIFYSVCALVEFNNCEGVVTGTYATIENGFFVDTTLSNNGVPHGIIVNGGHWKYLFGRLRKNQYSSVNTTLCKGNVTLTNISYKAIADSNNITIPIYEKENLFYLDYTKDIEKSFIFTEGFASSKVTNKAIEKTSDNKINFNITKTSEELNNFGVYKLIDVTNKRTFRIDMDITLKSLMTVNHNIDDTTSTNKCIIFLDENKNVIAPLSGGNNEADILQKSYTSSSGEVNFTLNRTYGIPTNCKYILYGVGGYGIQWQTSIIFTVNKLNIELM